jgi:hypothetical protein
MLGHLSVPQQTALGPAQMLPSLYLEIKVDGCTQGAESRSGCKLGTGQLVLGSWPWRRGGN